MSGITLPTDNNQFYDLCAYAVPWSKDPEGSDWDLQPVNPGDLIPEDLPVLEFYPGPAE